MVGPTVPCELGLLLAELRDRDGCELLVTAGLPPMMRIDGELVAVTGRDALSAPDVDELVHEVLGVDMMERFDFGDDVDFTLPWHDAPVRGTVFHQRGAAVLLMRLLPNEPPRLEELGVPPIAAQLALRTDGLLIVTGLPGSGVAATVAAVVRYVSERRACHILTVENPMRYLHRHAKAVVSQRQVGFDSRSVEIALRAAQRDDADVVALTGLPEPAGIDAVLLLAETGHLVVLGMHAPDVPHALDRILEAMPPTRVPRARSLLAGSFAGALCRRVLTNGSGDRVEYDVLMGTSLVRELIAANRTRELRGETYTAWPL